MRSSGRCFPVGLEEAREHHTAGNSGQSIRTEGLSARTARNWGLPTTSKLTRVHQASDVTAAPDNTLILVLRDAKWEQRTQLSHAWTCDLWGYKWVNRYCFEFPNCDNCDTEVKKIQLTVFSLTALYYYPPSTLGLAFSGSLRSIMSQYQLVLDS